MIRASKNSAKKNRRRRISKAGCNVTGLDLEPKPEERYEKNAACLVAPA